MQDMSGRKLGKYELRERLGRGGMAEVYKAYQTTMDRFIAIKVMLGHIAGDEEFIERFKREAQAVGRLRHQHIVQIFDFGIQDDVYYMAMEYIKGGTLKEYITKQGKLSVRDSLRVASQLSDALTYAHNAGMIHRDLKPANVMFIDDTYENAVLTDFGIARILGQSGLTSTGISVGTPDYMSPEIGKGEDSDHRADIYAMGIIIYEMLTGEVPYAADTPLAVVLKHIQAPLPTFAYGDDVPENVERIILRCLAKEPEDRFESARALKRAIDQAIITMDQTADTRQAESPIERATNVNTTVDTRPQRRNPNSMPVGETELSEDRRTSKMPQSEAPQSSSSSSNLPRLIAAAVVLMLIGGIAFALVTSGTPDDPNEVAALPTVTIETDEPTELAQTTEESQPTNTVMPTNEPPPPTNEPSTQNDGDNDGDGRGDDDDDGRGDNGGGDNNDPIELDFRGERPPHPDNLLLSSRMSREIDEAERELLTGDLNELLTELSAGLDQRPDDVELLFARAQVYTELYDEESALADAQRLVERAPNRARSYIALYDVQYAFNLPEARDTILQAFEIDPEDEHVLWRYAQSVAEWDEEIEWLERAEDARASGYRFMVYAGWTYFNYGLYERAIPYLEAIYRSGTLAGSFDNRANLIGALILTEQEDEAMDVAREAAMGESDVGILGELASAAFLADDFEQAGQWANRALSLSGDAYQAEWTQALLAWELEDDLWAAIDRLDSLRGPFFSGEFFPRYFNLRYDHDLVLDIARIFDDAESYDDALQAYTEYLDDDPWLAFVYEERALVHTDLDNTEEARRDFQRAIEIARDGGDLEYVESLIEQIEQLDPPPTRPAQGVQPTRPAQSPGQGQGGN